jgi:hypothetical protein
MSQSNSQAAASKPRLLMFPKPEKATFPPPIDNRLKRLYHKKVVDKWIKFCRNG